MDKAITQLEGREQSLPQQQQHLKLCLSLPLVKTRKPQGQSLNLFSVLGFWVSKSVGNLYSKARVSGGFCLRKIHYNGMVVNNSVFYTSTAVLEEEKATMESSMENKECVEEMKEMVGAGDMETFSDFYDEKGFWMEEKAAIECSLKKKKCVEEMEQRVGVGKMETNSDLIEKGRDSSSSSDFLTSETTGREEQSPSSSEGSSFPPSLGWSVKGAEDSHSTSPHGVEDGEKEPSDNGKLEKQSSVTSAISDIELMKERFAKLLLGEDMSGCGNGVSTALAISNAITNLCATLFGQLWRLEPLPQEKKAMWRREIEWLLCVSDHIVELIPTWQTFPDGSKLEVMTCRPRSDLYVNLPALRKLDNMLLEILDSFVNTEFWYIDQGVLAPDGDGSTSFRRALQRQEEKWWLPVPRVPASGLHENSRKQLQHKRDCTNQILKAAMAINNITLADMEVPKSYLESLPKNARASLGDLIYRYISSEQFSPEYLLTCLDLSSEHHALEIANRVEAAIYIWNKRTNLKPTGNTSRSSSRSSWEMVKELMVDADKREVLADRAESLLLCLKQRFPGLPQTTLDMSKIQCNKDVGKSILESYSRVLESLAFNIVARIDDLLYVDDFTKHSDSFSSLPKVGMIAHKGISVPHSIPFPSTPYKSAFTTPNFSPAISSPAKGDRSPFVTSSKISQRGLVVKKVLTDYLSTDTKAKEYSSGNSIQKSNLIEELSLFQTDVETIYSTDEGANPKKQDPREILHNSRSP